MKRLHYIVLFHFMAIAALLCVACNPDDDINVKEKENTEVIVPVIDSANVYFYQNDGIVRYVSNATVDSIVQKHDGALKLAYFNDGRVASYSCDMLDSISRVSSTGDHVLPFPDASSFIEAINNSTAPNSTDKTEPSAPTDEDADDYSDYIENFLPKNTIVFTWSDNTVEVSGSVKGVTVTKNNGHVTVQSTKGKMEYRLQGSTTDGSFKIADMNNTSTDDNNKKFVLVLNGVEITNPNGPAINIQSGKTVLVNMPKDKINSLKDGTTYTQSGTESQKGTFFSEGQLIFSGAGTLNVTSLGGHGICSDDYIRLRYNVGEINVTSAKDGFNTKDRFLMYGGTVKLNASSDGVSVRRGPFELYGGSLDITCIDDGIVSDYAQTDTAFVRIGGGNLKIATTGAKGHAVTTTGKLFVENGNVTAYAQGAASKCFTAGGGIFIADSYVKLSTKGNPQYDEEENDWSSAACIRSKRELSIAGSSLFLISSGQGSKCINADAGVNVESSALTLAAEGPDYEGSDNNVRSRAIDAKTLSLGAGTSLGISAAVTAIYVESEFGITGGNTFAYSLSDATNAVNVKGSMTQTGGLFMTGLSK